MIGNPNSLGFLKHFLYPTLSHAIFCCAFACFGVYMKFGYASLSCMVVYVSIYDGYLLFTSVSCLLTYKVFFCCICSELLYIFNALVFVYVQGGIAFVYTEWE